jgi:MerR family copper efflux transcriptional regulator
MTAESSEPTYSITRVAEAFDLPVSTLRYYDEIGLVRAEQRRARVRHYDEQALRRLVYVQLLRLDALLGIEHTQAILASQSREQRNELLRQRRDELADRIRRLREADEVLAHMMYCPHDAFEDCPVMLTYLNERVRAALDHPPGQPRSEREAAVPALRRVVEAVIGPLNHLPEREQPAPPASGQPAPPASGQPAPPTSDQPAPPTGDHPARRGGKGG